MFINSNPKDFLTRFRKDEDGGMIIFSLYLFVMMLAIGGMAVDLMRFETARAQLQSCTDTALLAAADLDQGNDPATVFNDYMDKCGMSDFVQTGSPVVVEGINYRSVTADATIELPTLFMNMMGITQLDAPSTGTAIESVSEVEISLVLDISGSMGWASNTGTTTKLEELQAAANLFVDMIYQRSDPDEVSISIIPYSTQVALPPNLLDQYNVTRGHNYSSCVNFDYDDFNTVSLPTNQALEHTQHFAPWGKYGPVRYDHYNRSYVCRPEAASAILPMSGDPDVLKAHINALTPGGNTSIDIGVKWGVALLDPSAQPAINALIANNEVNSVFSGRPYTVASGQSMKIVIVMTDGKNTTQYMLDDTLRGSMSDVYEDPVSGHYFVDSDEEGHRDGDGIPDERWFYPRAERYGWGNQWRRDWEVPANLRQLPYSELMNEVTMQYNADYHYGRQHDWSSDYNSQYNNILETVNAGTKNSRLDDICDVAKSDPNNMVVYTIGFEVDDPSAAVMADCASSASHFYRVGGPEIMDAFQSIARQVNELRLVQ
ncbi:pilus assembly protein TadG-related protein [Aestuariibius sp. HNIBRBA575]|uniref:TadE/TadG family type IV pilus assembly protein n=1 Tax=Aestuariibius sp. HNIBRBA575 TaxID=3233343 RepID=UPI0034A285ED